MAFLARNRWGSWRPPDVSPLAPDQVSEAQLVGWYQVGDSATLGTTLIQTSGGAQKITLSGNLNQALGLWIIITKTGNVGVAEFNLSLDIGATFVMMNVKTSSSPVQVLNTGLFLNFTGPFPTLNVVFQSVCRTLRDKVNSPANDCDTHATQPTQNPVIRTAIANAGNQPGIFMPTNSTFQMRNVGGPVANAFAGGVNQPFTMVARFSINSIIAGNTAMTVFCVSSSTDATEPRVELLMGNDSDGINFRFRRFDGVNDVRLKSVAPPQIEHYLVHWVFDGQKSIMGLNGASIIGGDSGVLGSDHTVPGALSFDQLGIGYRFTASQQSNYLFGTFFSLALFRGAVVRQLPRLLAYF